MKAKPEIITRLPVLGLLAATLCIAIILTGVIFIHLRQLPEPNSAGLLTSDHLQVIRTETERLVLISGVMSLLLAICVGMMLAGVRRFTREQQSIEQQLKQMNDRLEQKVAERTSELRLSEESLEKERYLLRTVTDALPDFIWIKDEQCRFTFANTASVEFSRSANGGSLVGKTDFDFHPPEHAAKYFADEQAFLQSDQDSVQHEDLLVDAEGNRTWVITTRAILRDETGKKVGFVGISRDITAQRQTQETLAAERKMLRTLTDALPELIWVKDMESRFLFANEATMRFARMAGIDNIIGKTDLDIHPSELTAKYFADEQAFLQSNQDIAHYEDLLMDAEGNRTWVITTRAVLRDETGEKVGFVGISQDITAQRQIQETLAAERTMLRTVIDLLPDLIYVKNTQSRFIIGNAAVAAIMGISSDELLGKSDFDVSPYEIAQAYYTDDQQVMQSGKALINREERGVDSAGTERWLTTTKIPLRDAHGKITGLVGVSRDITEQRSAEEALHRMTEDLWHERAQLRAILDSMTEGVIFDEELQVRYINKALSEMMGYSFDDWWGSYLDLLKPVQMNDEEFAIWRSKIFEIVRDVGIWQDEVQLRRKDGNDLSVEMTITRVTDSDGHVIGAVTIIRDISSQKALEAQKARFVANASHELRTPITNLKTRLYLFRKQPENSDSHLVVMERVVERMRRLVEDLLDVSRFEHGQIVLNLEPVLLRTLVEEVIDTQRPEAEAKSITLNTVLSGDTLEIQADPERMIQVITNLVTNAINYTLEGGHILVEMVTAESDNGIKQAVIRVSDNGPGIEPESLEHIFQPFFRATSGKSTGSGLGLAICKEIVEAHGGEISAESKLGHGSCFIVALPRKQNS